MVRDWVYGDVSASGRSRPMMVGVMDSLSGFTRKSIGVDAAAL